MGRKTLGAPLFGGTLVLYQTSSRARSSGAPGEIRTPNLLIRSQMLYPLSYERSVRGV